MILNGVFGWGVNDPESMEQTLRGIARVLRPEGALLVGWNDDRSPDPSSLAVTEELFASRAPAGLPARQGFSDVTHVYSWYRRH